jgi:hypothetical protein
MGFAQDVIEKGVKRDDLLAVHLPAAQGFGRREFFGRRESLFLFLPPLLSGEGD